MAAPTIAQAVAVGGASNGTSLTATFVGTTTAGHYLSFYIQFSGNPGTVTATGWTLVNNWTNGSAQCYLFEKVNAAATVAASASWTSATTAAALAIDVAGGDTVTPRNGAPVETTGTGTAMSGGSLTTSNATVLLLSFMGQGSTGLSAYSYSSPGGGTGAAIAGQNASTHSSAPFQSAGVACVDFATSATGSYAGTANSNISGAWTGVTIAVQPSSSPATPAESFLRRNVTETRYRDTGELVNF